MFCRSRDQFIIFLIHIFFAGLLIVGTSTLDGTRALLVVDVFTRYAYADFGSHVNLSSHKHVM
jgi:hypothetical protein